MIKRDSILVVNYLEVLKNRVFKIIPLYEEKNAGLSHYIDSLTFELDGLQYAVEGFSNSHIYISIISTLESILNEVLMNRKGFKFLRSQVLDTLSLIEKLQVGVYK